MDVRPNSITKVEKISQRTTLFSGGIAAYWSKLVHKIGAND